MTFGREWLERPAFARFMDVAARFPSKVAVDDGVRRLTYKELFELASAIAHRITSIAPPSAPVGIALPNDFRFPAAMLACLAVGRPYVPLDQSFPAERNAAVAEHAGIAATIAEDLAVVGHGRQIDSPASATPEDFAYILYTSGTTGRPKGVYQNQRNLLHDVMQYTTSAQITAEDELTQLYSPCVNGAIRDIYGALLNGATLHIVDLRRQGFGRLQHLMRQQTITILHCMPPVLRAFLRGIATHEVFETVRLVYLAGDRLFRQDLEQCWPHLPAHARVYAAIGSTENATIYRQWFLDRQTGFNGDLVPVGYPVADRPSIVAAAGSGQTGEIVVTSRYMALGYWNDAALSAEKFLPSPEDPQARIFHTGDLGYEDPDGLLHFVGRADRQVKIRGHRIELDEVEACLRSCRGVVDAAVAGEEKLVAFLVLHNGTSTNTVAAEMRGRFPSHLVPAGFREVSAIPTLENFKPDTNNLNKLATEVPHEVAAAWRAVLGTASIAGTRWDDAGGDSLQLLEILLRLEGDLGRRLPTSIVSLAMTPESLTAGLSALPPLSPPAGAGGDQLPLLFLAPGLSGPDLRLISFARSLENCSRVEVLDYGISDAVANGAQAFGDLIERLREHVLSRAGQRPVFLAGYSFGGRVVFELAQCLECRQVEVLWVIDAAPRRAPWDRPARVPLRRKGIWDRFRRKMIREWMGVLARGNRFSWIRATCRISREAEEQAARAIRLWTSRRYPLRPYPGCVTLIRTGEEDDLGWGGHCGGVAVIRIPGVNHEQIMSSPELVSIVRSGLQTRSRDFREAGILVAQPCCP